MAIYEIPSYKLTQCLFEPAESVGRAKIGGGVSVALTETMETVFRVDVETVPLTPAERAAWRAWRSKLRGGMDLFSMYDVSKANPLAYPDATSAASISSGWDGTADVTSIGSSGLLGLAGLPLNYVLTEGDYIGLEQSGRYDLYQVATTATANGSPDNEVAVYVRPFLRSGIFSTSAVARIWRPVATFVIDIESWSESAGVSPSPISFSGIQRI
jgi:hypothetical protein